MIFFLNISEREKRYSSLHTIWPKWSGSQIVSVLYVMAGWWHWKILKISRKTVYAGCEFFSDPRWIPFLYLRQRFCDRKAVNTNINFREKYLVYLRFYPVFPLKILIFPNQILRTFSWFITEKIGMIKRSYLSLLWSQYRGTSIILTLLIALFQLLIIWIFNSLNATPFLETVFNQLPLQLRLLFEQEFMPALSVAGAVAFGFNHPLVLIAISIVAVVIPSRQIAGESENGRLEMLLSLPIKRKELTFSLLIFTSGISLMIITGGMVGSMTGLLITGNFNLSLLCNLLEICINLWLVFLLIGSYSILISVFSQEGSRAGLLSGGLTLIFYLFYFLSSVWPPLEFTRYFNIFYYYQPQRLMFDKIEFLDNIFVLLITAAICILAFLVRFEKRDIP
ncbi:MAG: hypothetical protein EH225_13690 [Calditrichaeota bacterium]|nr:MAG: hypothetical protein EH221_11750 [bacterium]RQV98136.1 MAG: hypothetical protein EH225_13690 [Calditrichota bacterium]